MVKYKIIYIWVTYFCTLYKKYRVWKIKKKKKKTVAWILLLPESTQTSTWFPISVSFSRETSPFSPLCTFPSNCKFNFREFNEKLNRFPEERSRKWTPSKWQVRKATHKPATPILLATPIFDYSTYPFERKRSFERRRSHPPTVSCRALISTGFTIRGAKNENSATSAKRTVREMRFLLGTARHFPRRLYGQPR